MDSENSTKIVYGSKELGKSRSQKKRESTALQKLGEELAALDQALWRGMSLPPDLLAALEELRGMSKHEARRRQMQYIGRIMRELDDAERESIQGEMSGIVAQKNADAAKIHRAEAWRVGLMKEESRESVLREVLSACPQAGEKQLRHLAVQAALETGQGKKTRAFRELFRYLRGLDLSGGD